MKLARKFLEAKIKPMIIMTRDFNSFPLTFCCESMSSLMPGLPYQLCE